MSARLRAASVQSIELRVAHALRPGEACIVSSATQKSIATIRSLVDDLFTSTVLTEGDLPGSCNVLPCLAILAAWLSHCSLTLHACSSLDLLTTVQQFTRELLAATVFELQVLSALPRALCNVHVVCGHAPSSINLTPIDGRIVLPHHCSCSSTLQLLLITSSLCEVAESCVMSCAARCKACSQLDLGCATHSFLLAGLHEPSVSILADIGT
jgi:hypothetical protein